MKFAVMLVFASVAIAQQAVTVTDDPPQSAVQSILAYDGSHNLLSVCSARSTVTTGARASTFVAISAISKASAAVVTSVGHGFKLASRPSVTISGATGSGWVTGINVTKVATVIDADTFSVPVDSSGFGTLAGTVVFTTTAPRQGVAEWSVKKLDYSGTDLIGIAWLLGSSFYGAKCSDAAGTTVQLQ